MSSKVKLLKRVVMLGVAFWGGDLMSETTLPGQPSLVANSKLWYNSDGNQLFHGEKRPVDLSAPWHSRHMLRKAPLSVNELVEQIDEVADAGAGVFLICPVSYQVVTYRSDIERRLGDGSTDAQLARASLSIRSTVASLRNFDALGVDPFDLAVRRIREKGMSPILTWRLQQAHVIYGEERSIAQSPFVAEHPEYRIKGASGGDNASVLDFAQPAVRARKLALIREFVVKYGMDGCQLDYQRFPLFFAKGKEAEGIPHMNAFVKSVREMLDEEGKKMGRRLSLCVRIPENPVRCRELGLEPATWVNEGWADSVVVTTFLYQNPVTPFPIPHYEMDIQAFRGLFKKTVPVYGSIQVFYGVRATSTANKVDQLLLSPDDFRSEASKLWKKGADGIELFNFFLTRSHQGPGKRVEPPFFVLKELGDPQLIGKAKPPEEAAWKKIYGEDTIPEKYRALINEELAKTGRAGD